MTILKPVSDAARRVLAALGESPAEHQSQVLAMAKGIYTKSHSTKKGPDVHALNRKVEQALTYTQPVSEITKRLESAKTFEEEWVPDAYVLFVRRFTCTSCGNAGNCLDIPALFLRHRKRSAATAAQQEREGNPRLYQPIRSVVHSRLPKLKEVVVKALVVCENCFEGKVECETTRAELSVQESTESFGSEALTETIRSTERSLALLQELQAATSSLQPEEIAGFDSLFTFTSDQTGSDCGRSRNEEGQNVPVLDSHSRIREDANA